MATLYTFFFFGKTSHTFDSWRFTNWYALLYTVAMFQLEWAPPHPLKADICNFISLVMFVEQNTLAKKLCPCIRGRLIDCVDTTIYHAKKKGKSWQTLFETKCFLLPKHFDMPKMESNAVATLYTVKIYTSKTLSLYLNLTYFFFK